MQFSKIAGSDMLAERPTIRTIQVRGRCKLIRGRGCEEDVAKATEDGSVLPQYYTEIINSNAYSITMLLV